MPADNLDELRRSHTPAAVARRLQDGPDHSHLRDFTYGAIDGAVTTFAIVSGVAGADLSAGVVLVLGTANLIADGFSMAASNYLGTRAEVQQRDRARRSEERQIELFPEGEREEIRQLLSRKGFGGDDLKRAVDIVTADRDRWVDMMLLEELGQASQPPSPLNAAAATFLAFLLVGSVPLLPFFVGLAGANVIGHPFLASSGMTAFAFFGVGAAKSQFVEQSWLRAGSETLAVGGAAAALAYVVGRGLGGLL